jgi:glycosyltransferase involved in cell wall biosynthesis
VLADKGVREYVDAARVLRKTHPDVRFQLLGPLDEKNPSGIKRPELDEWIADGSIEYLGKSRDVRPFLAAAHVCVLPSYGEGTPRSVLEAMAMARPIVTTDTPGCRQTVEEGKNGFLVPARESSALAAVLERIVNDPDSLAGMGRRSRSLAEERFDVHAVNRVILRALDLDGAAL